MKELKSLDYRLLSELIKDSRRSDRMLAKALGTSQPTVTRTRTKLEKQGYIKEYTMFPNFVKLGYELMAFTFIKFARILDPEEMEKARKIGLDRLKTDPADIILISMGSGIGYSGVIVSIHKNYSSYEQLKKRITRYAKLGLSEFETFITTLTEESQFIPLTLSMFAKGLIGTEQS